MWLPIGIWLAILDAAKKIPVARLRLVTRIFHKCHSWQHVLIRHWPLFMPFKLPRRLSKTLPENLDIRADVTVAAKRCNFRNGKAVAPL